MTRFLHALHKSRRCGLHTFECLQIYSKVKTLRQVCEDKGNEAMVLLSSGCDVTVISTWYWHRRDAMSVLLECVCPCCQDVVSCRQGVYVGVIGTGCWRHQDVVGVIGTGCWCRQDAVSVSSGHGVGVIGMRCWRHQGAVSVLVSSGGRGPHHGHLRVACLTAILETSMRCDMICKQ